MLALQEFKVDDVDRHGAAIKAQSKYANAFFQRMDERDYDYVKVCMSHTGACSEMHPTASLGAKGHATLRTAHRMLST